jgi:hypothetical protein
MARWLLRRPLPATFLGVTPFLFRLGVEGDGIGYFSYLPALFRGSLELGPEYRGFLTAGAPHYGNQLTVLTATGYHENAFPIGPALLSLPAYAVARLGGLLAGIPRPEATWLPGTVAFNLVSLLLGLAGLLLCQRIATRFAGAGAAAAATILCWLAGPLLFYASLQTDYSHTFSLFAVALFAYLALVTAPEASLGRWALVGAAAGLMAVTRWQDLVYVALVPFVLAPGLTRRTLGPRLLRVLAAGAATVLVSIPQLWSTHLIHGYWIPQVAPALTMDFAHPQVWLTLFSSHHGLLAWAPVLALGVIGLAMLFRRARWAAAGMLACLALTLWVNASLSEWWEGVAFGGRRFIGAYPFFIVGVAVLIERLPRWSRRLQLALAAALVAWNVLLLAQFRYIQNGDVDPGYGGLVRAQFQALKFVPRLFGQGSVVHGLGIGLLHLQPAEVFGAIVLMLLIALPSIALAAGAERGTG